MSTSMPGAKEGLPGVAVAGGTALISGVSVFVNSYGVHAVKQPAVYTTAKNLVAVVILLTVVAIAGGLRRSGRWPLGERWTGTPPRSAGRSAGAWSPTRVAALAYVGVVGGGIAFILFFDGLARTTATPAAFLRDSLVIWVAVLALPFLGERLHAWNIAAIGLLLAGQVVLLGGVGHLVAGSGQALILVATLLWAVEVVIAKRLLVELSPATVSLVRMGVGAVVLVAYLAVRGLLGALTSFTPVQWQWVLLTGLLLAGYVGTWMTALARARAVDVTSVLVASTLVTTLLTGVTGPAPLTPDVLGLLLIAAGVATVAWSSRHPGLA
jgi:drug/metabolite transporter (DMT)-like permease